jgi:hypothetical protein
MKQREASMPFPISPVRPRPRLAPVLVSLFALTRVLTADLAPAHAQCLDWGAGPGPAPLTFSLLPDGNVADIEVLGSTAWIARTEYGALVSVDLSDPGHPTVLGAEPVAVMDETYHVEVSGNLAFVTWIQWGGPAGVRLFDISDPADPVDVGNFTRPGNWAFDMAARGSLLYISFPYTTVGVLDVGNPSSPVLIGQVPVANPYELALDGDLLYVSTDGQPQIIDVSDPTQPAFLAVLPTTSPGTRVEAAGGLAYVSTNTGLQIFDVTDPSQPTPVGSLATPNIATSVDISGDLAYVFVRNTGVHVVDVSNAAAPALVGVIPMPTVQFAPVYEFGEYVYVPDEGFVRFAPRQCPLAPADAGPLPAAGLHNLRAAPNPFNPQTTVTFELPTAAVSSLEIFDPAGRRLRVLARGESLAAGPHARTWNGRDDAGRDVPSGTYVCRLLAGGMASTSRVTLLR